MLRKYRVYQIDSFTDEKFTGNPAGVVTNAEGLSEQEMQKIARELNNSETAFIFGSQSAEYDVHVRFFTPRTEVPICEHATIAAHYVRALENRLGTTRVLQRTGAGILPVDIIQEDNNYRVIMTQGKIEFGAVLNGQQRSNLLSALKLREEDVLEECPIQIVSTGHSKVMVGIKETAVLDQLKPNDEALVALSNEIQCNGYYIFTLNPEDKGPLVQGRMFAPAIGVDEDPVTGNANGPLGAYLVHHRLVAHGGTMFNFQALQGVAMGRPGTITVDVSIANEEPMEVKVSGKAVIAFRTELSM